MSRIKETGGLTFPTVRNTLKTTYGALVLLKFTKNGSNASSLFAETMKALPSNLLMFPLQHFRPINLVRSVLILH